MNARSSCATVAAIIAIALSGCASVVETPVPVGTDLAPAAPCLADAAVPQLLSTSASVFGERVWSRRASWETQLRFRVDERGVPNTVSATADAPDEDRADLEQAAVAAFERYRFCPPTPGATELKWTARMRFTPAPVSARIGGGRMIMQFFLPAYQRSDIAVRRTGANLVRGTFAPDGHPLNVRLVTSSDDVILDRKSLEAMASVQLVFGPGTSPTGPLQYEQPYKYEIR